MGKSDHDAQQHEYEFFGPYVPGLLTVVLPLVVLGLSYACNAQGCVQLLPWVSLPGFPSNQLIYTHEAMLAVTGWFALVLLLHLLLPGQLACGVQLPNRQRLTYKLNGERIISADCAAGTTVTAVAKQDQWQPVW